MADHGWLGPIEWAAKSRPRPGEDVCGDRLIAVDVDGTAALIGVLDGLGHGADAAEAANLGVVFGDCYYHVLASYADSEIARDNFA